jgi:cation-transporting ATPase 13A3/4/5
MVGVGKGAKGGILIKNATALEHLARIDTVILDKTGTLTTDNLDFICARMIDRSGETPKAGKTWFPAGSTKGLDKQLKYAMASCHSVSKLGDSLVGSQMEINMVRAIEWSVLPQQDGTTLLASSADKDSIRIVRRFDFSFTRQAMGVVAREEGSGDAYIFMKGSFESVSIMTTQSSVPGQFDSIVTGFGDDGFYTLAMAFRRLGPLSDAEIEALERKDVERDLELLGLIAFRNELKVTMALGALRTPAAYIKIHRKRFIFLEMSL